MAGSTYTHGFLIEPAATYGDVRSLSTTLFKIGLPPAGGNNELIDIDIPMGAQENKINGQTYPTLSTTNYPADNIQVGPFTPVNCIPWVMMFGGYNAGTDTISNFTAGSPKPRYSLYQSITDNAVNQDRSVFGWVCNQLDFNYVFGKSFTMNMTGMAEAHNMTDYTPTAYKFPDSDGDGTGTESIKPYDFINTLTWNSQSLGNPWNVKGTFVQSINGFIGSSGMYTEINDQDIITGSITLTALGFIGNGTNGLLTDWKAGTPRTLSFTMKKSGDSNGTNVVTFSNCLCTNVSQSKVSGEKVITTANFLIGAASIARVNGTDTDGTHDAFYAMS